MLCIRCHKEIPDGSNFCNFCGKRQPDAPPAHTKAHRRSPGTGSVYKLKDIKSRKKPWVASYKRTIIGTFATSGEAVNALDAYLASVKPIEAFKITFAQVYAEWSPKHYESITSKSKSAFVVAFDRASALHDRKMSELKTADYQAIIDGMSDMSRSSCEKQRQLFSQMCKYAQQRDIISQNYAAFLELPKAAPINDRVFTSDEITSLWCWINDDRLGETARITLALTYTGMRINELLHLYVSDCHIDEGYVIGGSKTDAGRNRVIPLHPDIIPLFQKWLEQTDDSGWLLPSAHGTARRADGVRKSFNSLMAKLGIQGITPHSCRHTAATILANANVSTDTIKRILGHTDYAFTSNRYTSTNIDSLIEGIHQVASFKPD